MSIRRKLRKITASSAIPFSYSLPSFAKLLRIKTPTTLFRKGRKDIWLGSSFHIMIPFFNLFLQDKIKHLEEKLKEEEHHRKLFQDKASEVNRALYHPPQ